MPKTYVLDTSVLLADPRSFARFDEHEVVLPLVVLTELEAQAQPPRAGLGGPPGAAGARGAAHRARHARPARCRSTTAAARCGSRSTTRTRPACPPPCAPTPTTTASWPSPATWPTRAHDVAVVTKDLPLRLKASIVGLAADEYRNELVGRHQLDRLRRARRRARADRRAVRATASSTCAEARDLPCHTGLALHAGSQSALARVHADKRLHLVRTDAARVRRARPLGRAAHRHRPPGRPRDRHRQPRRQRRHRQERARAGRRARGRARAAHAQAGRGVPAALRRRRPGPRVPARAPRPRRWARGRPRSSTPSSRSWATRSSTRSSTAGCSRCSRSPTSGAAA